MMDPQTIAAEEFLASYLTPPFVLTPLRRGQVNTAWQVEAGGQYYFLKYQGVAQQNGTHRQHEARLQRDLAQHSLAPRVVGSSQDHRWVLHEWICAPTLASVPDEDQQSRLLALSLWRIHQHRPNLPRWSLQHRVAKYLATVAQYDDTLAKFEQGRLAPYHDLIELWDSHQTVFCHNDLATDHVLLSTPHRIVDWEYAGYGHALFDIASCIEINQLSDAAQHTLCRVYSEASGQSIQAPQLQRWRELLQVINALWTHAHQVQH